MTDHPPTWPMTLKVWRHEDLLDQMLDRLHIDPITAVRVDAGAAFLHARARCIHCAHSATCRSLQTEQSAAVPPVFCANLGFFARCYESAMPGSCSGGGE